MQASHRRARRAALLGLAVAATGCASKLNEPITGYTCCNLRVHDGWISSNNVQGGSLLPLGQPVRLTSIKRQYYVYGAIGDSDYGLRDDSAKTQADTLRWIGRTVVSEDPRRMLDSWPAEVKAAVSAARLIVVMTRDEVSMAIGHPSPTDTPDLAATTWRYWTPAEDTPADLTFAADGRLAEISGKPSAIRTVLLQR